MCLSVWRWRGPSGLRWVWRNGRGPHLEGGWGVSRGTHASQPPPLRVPWAPQPQRGKARWWVWLCRCRGLGGWRSGAELGAVLVDGFASPEWEPCPGAWKTGDAGEPNFLMARGSVLTTRRVCLASGRCDGHRALRSPLRLLGAGSPRAGSPTHRYMPAH